MKLRASSSSFISIFKQKQITKNESTESSEHHNKRIHIIPLKFFNLSPFCRHLQQPK